MTDPLRFVPPRVAFVDPRTGLITREWYLFFQGVFDRIGGASGPSTTDLMASLFEDAGSSETNAMLFEADQAARQIPLPYQPAVALDNVAAELSALQDRVSELVKEIDSIKQGILI